MVSTLIKLVGEKIAEPLGGTMKEKLFRELKELLFKLTDTPGWMYDDVVQGLVDYLCEHYEISGKK